MNNMQLSCAIHSSWGNISVAGDFNPTVAGMISGVGYLTFTQILNKSGKMKTFIQVLG